MNRMWSLSAFESWIDGAEGPNADDVEAEPCRSGGGKAPQAGLGGFVREGWHVCWSCCGVPCQQVSPPNTSPMQLPELGL